MSDMKYDAIVGQGIPIIDRIPIPNELLPADSKVEMAAKIKAGYYTGGAQITDEPFENVHGRNWSNDGREWEELVVSATLQPNARNCVVDERHTALNHPQEDACSSDSILEAGRRSRDCFQSFLLETSADLCTYQWAEWIHEAPTYALYYPLIQHAGKSRGIWQKLLFKALGAWDEMMAT
jgi:hypothetical protein